MLDKQVAEGKAGVWSFSENQQFLELITAVFGKGLVSHSIVDDVDFRQMVAAFARPGFEFPHRTKVTELCDERAKRVDDFVRCCLCSNNFLIVK